MTIIDTMNPNSIYNIGGHFLFYMLFSATICVFVDISPLQKHTPCQLNFLLATIVSAAIPSAITSFLTFSSSVQELFIGISAAGAISALTILTIQKLINIDVNF